MKRRYTPPPATFNEKTVTADKNVLAKKWKSGEVFLAIGLDKRPCRPDAKIMFPATSDTFACQH